MRLASETSRAVMDGLDKARRGLWYIGISEGNGQAPLQDKYRTHADTCPVEEPALRTCAGHVSCPPLVGVWANLGVVVM